MDARIDPTRLLEGLNDRQREAVQAIEGPVLVLAGPGSGKTRVLTHRVAWLVGMAGVPPWHILAVTFTNKAAREMKDRLATLVGPQALDRLTVGTFHAICARILRREADGLGFGTDFVIFDTDDQLKLIREAMEALNLDPKTYRPQAVLGAISNAKNELIRPADYVAQTYWHEVAGRVYQRYQAGLRQNNALDFDDLLLETACLMRDNAVARRHYQARYPFLMVDEFQDTNTAQYALLKAVAASDDPDAPHNLFVVGDEDQSIYRWRGADWRNIQRFRADFPDSRTILLEQNYRSSQTILDTAQAIIDRNANRTQKQLWTEAGAGVGVTVFECYDEAEEAAYLVREIDRRVAAGASYADFGVMYRTNAQSRAIEDAFVRWRIPYQLVGGTRFYDRREVRDVLAYLRFLHNPRDQIALERIINVPPRNIGPKAWNTLVDWGRLLGTTLWDALGVIASDDEDQAVLAEGAPALDPRARKALSRFHEIMAGLMAAKATIPVPDLLDQVLEASGYMTWLRDGTDEGEERWENVRELRGVAMDFESLPPGEGLSVFLESVSLVSDVDSLDGRGGARVTLLTLHAAKGLEYPVVFIAGVEEQRLPHARSLDDPESLAEERRLFYVGVTRAREKLYLLHTYRRTIFGSSEISEPSRFLDDIPPKLVEGKAGPARRSAAGRTTAAARATTWEPARPASTGGAARPSSTPMSPSSTPMTPAASAPPRSARPAAVAGPAFRAGDRVRHGAFGEGVVVSSTVRDGDEEVTVAFVGGGGVKKLMQQFARLQKV